MKKIIISTLLCILFIFSCLTVSLFNTLGYKNQQSTTIFTDILTGYTSEHISCEENELRYYDVLTKDTYSSLNVFQALKLIFCSDNIRSMTWASSKRPVTSGYEMEFFLCDVILCEENTYLYVSYISEDGFKSTIFRADKNLLQSVAEYDDFQTDDIASALILDSFSTLLIKGLKHAVPFGIISVTTIAAVLFLKKQKKQTTNANKTGK